jgi:hypothetical protein
VIYAIYNYVYLTVFFIRVFSGFTRIASRKTSTFVLFIALNFLGKLKEILNGAVIGERDTDFHAGPHTQTILK